MNESHNDRKVRVAVRIRPHLEMERYDVPCINKDDDETLRVSNTHPGAIAGARSEYLFDHVFDETDSQQDVYAEAFADFMEAAIEGRFVTVIAYGQTGTGKTHTVLGNTDDVGAGVTPSTGLFLRVVHDTICALGAGFDATLSVTEIFNDDVFDLLQDRRKVVMRDSGDGILIEGLTRVDVRSLTDLVTWYRVAESHRRTTATRMNSASSRSHALLTLELRGRGQIVLVDLAGSERVKKSAAEDESMVEARLINTSLSVLGNVIHAIVSEAKHIPFRDCKLTRALRGAFTSPYARILLIATLSPVCGNYQESLSTLQFANRLKDMKSSRGAGREDTMHDYDARDQMANTMRAFHALCADVRIARVLGTPGTPVDEMPFLDDALRPLREAHRSDFEPLKATEVAAFRAIEEHNAVVAEIAAMEGAFKQREDSIMRDAKKAKKARKLAEEGIEALRKRIGTLMVESTALTETLADAQSNHSNAAGDAHHISLSNFALTLKSLRSQQLRYFVNVYDSFLHRDRLQHSEPASADELKFLVDLAYFLVERSVDVALGDIDSHEAFAVCDVEDCSCRLVAPAAFSRPLTLNRGYAPLPPGTTVGLQDNFDSGDEETPSPLVQKHKALSKPPIAVLKVDDDVKLAVRKVTRQLDVAEAEHEYLMRVYDSTTLVTDLVKYLEYGSTLMKHGRKGVPHARRMWVSQKDGKMYWKDAAKVNDEVRSTKFSDVTGLVLGPYSKVFLRNKMDPRTPTAHLSFTVELRGILEKKTVDVVAANLVDFEAWVIGLSNICNVEPTWGVPLDISMDPRYADVTPAHRQHCSQQHVPPTVYFAVRGILEARREEIVGNLRISNGSIADVYAAIGGIHPPALDKQGAMLLTKGELRFMCQQWEIDVFRVCALWRMLSDERLIFDPNFSVPVVSKPKDKKKK